MGTENGDRNKAPFFRNAMRSSTYTTGGQKFVSCSYPFILLGALEESSPFSSGTAECVTWCHTVASHVNSQD